MFHYFVGGFFFGWRRKNLWCAVTGVPDYPWVFGGESLVSKVMFRNNKWKFFHIKVHWYNGMMSMFLSSSDVTEVSKWNQWWLTTTSCIHSILSLGLKFEDSLAILSFLGFWMVLRLFLFRFNIVSRKVYVLWSPKRYFIYEDEYFYFSLRYRYGTSIVSYLI